MDKKTEKMDKTALVTGASRGIGKAIAVRFAEEGYKVALLSQHLEDLLMVVKELEKFGEPEKYFPIECNINEPEKCRKAFAEIYGELGSIDILVNNAAVHSRRALAPAQLEKWVADFEYNLNGWKEEISTNLTGSYVCSYLAAEYMLRQRKGNIINISSVKGFEATSSPGYGASKAGVMKLTVDMAKALAPYGIRVNCLAPGFIDTGMTAELPENKKQQYRAQIPLQRFGKVEEVAKAAMFLASEDASYITGATIIVDGGYLL